VCTRGSNRALLGGPSTSPLGERNATHQVYFIVRGIDLGQRVRVEITVEFARFKRR
jgi:hypothetical protein